jgi:predicted transcriptional regulator
MSNDLVPTRKELPILKGSLKHCCAQKSNYELKIRKLSLPNDESGFDEKIAWICNSLGFFEDIDKNKNAAAIFKEIFLATIKGQVLTSTTIAQRVGVSRGAVINQLNKLHSAGLIDKGGKYYFMRHRTMEKIIEEVEDDITHIFSRIKKVAKGIDSKNNQTIQM